MTDAITRLIEDQARGEPGALDRLLPLVYDDLKRLAHRQRRAASGSPTLSTTVLVHEAYLKLAGSGTIAASDRRHFMALCARAMRQVLVDHARARLTQKRGAGIAAAPLDAEAAGGDDTAQQLIALAQALDALSARDPGLVETLELAWFAGLETGQIADLLRVTARTVQRDLRRARAWLGEALGT
jgi:RNA polymerase sigma factor (TIGR02999 family)